MKKLLRQLRATVREWTTKEFNKKKRREIQEPVFIAVVLGDRRELERLTNAGFRLEGKARDGHTALISAVDLGLPEFMRARAHPNGAGGSGRRR